jgi:SET domain-containing protein
MDSDYKAIKSTIKIQLPTCKPSPIQGTGLFATDAIPTGKRLIEYAGEKIGGEEMLQRCEAGNSFIFALRNGEYLDGGFDHNLARFINHSCEPNCEMRWEETSLWIVALRDISAGEEITFNYGYDLEDYRRHLCYCGSPCCVGYIVAEEYFDHVRSQNELRNANP